MKHLVTADRQTVPARCREIRVRLAEFAADKLGPTAAGEVRGHLARCEACNEVFFGVLLEQVARDKVLTSKSPVAPPPFELYERSLRAGGRLGTLWGLVRDALQAADRESREWATERLNEIKRALESLVVPLTLPEPVKTRGSVRSRDPLHGDPSAASAETRIVADVLTRDLEPTGATVSFDVYGGPSVTSRGRFTLHLGTETAAHVGARVVCSVHLARTQAVAFEGRLVRVRGRATSEVVIDEIDVPGPAGTIPLSAITVVVITD